MKARSLLIVGVILVAFPLACQIIFVVSLSRLLAEVQTESERTVRSRKTVADAHNIVFHLGDFLITQSLNPDSRGTDSGLQIIQELKNDISAVMEGIDTSHIHRDRIERLRSSADELLARFEKAVAAQSASGLADDKNFYRNSAQFFQELIELVEMERKLYPGFSPLSPDIRDRIVLLLGSAVGSSIILALFFGYVYAIIIRTPLKRIEENCRKLASDQKLLPPLSRQDELGALDRQVHTVAREIQIAMDSERDLIAKASDLICSIGTDQIFLSANPYSQKLLGLSPEELQGNRLSDFVPPEDILRADAYLREAIGSAEMKSFEFRMIGDGGTIIDTSWSAVWSNMEQALFCVVRDVSREKAIAEERSRFEELVKISLREPLERTQSAIYAIGTIGNLTAGARAEVDAIERSASTLIDLIDDLLDFSHLNEEEIVLNLQRENIFAVVRESADLIEALARDRKVELIVPEGEFTINCDKEKIKQALINLLANAVKYSPEHNSVEVNITFNTLNQIEIAVSDCGPGVDNNLRARVFEPFERLDGDAQKHSGTGLGLSIFKMIVETHGGDYGARDRDPHQEHELNERCGRGITFWFTLPVER